jgi:hypothetical protein
MESLFRLPFTFVQCPNLKLKKPSWIRKPSNATWVSLWLCHVEQLHSAFSQLLVCFSLRVSVLFGLLVSYFLVTAGVIYDVIVEPPSVGQYAYIEFSSFEILVDPFRQYHRWVRASEACRFHGLAHQWSIYNGRPCCSIHVHLRWTRFHSSRSNKQA